MNKTTIKLIRWILFIPVSIFSSWLIFYLLNFIDLEILKLISIVLAETVKGFFVWLSSGLTLMFVAFLLIPSKKIQTLKIYGIFVSVLTIGWIIFSYLLAEKEIVGSFWFPLILNFGFLIGIWLAYWKLIPFNNID